MLDSGPMLFSLLKCLQNLECKIFWRTSEISAPPTVLLVGAPKPGNSVYLMMATATYNAFTDATA